MLGNRNDSRKSAVEPQVAPQVSIPSEPAPIRPQATQASSVAVIGPKIRFSGELVGEEDLIVQGSVEGTIDLKGHNLTIGEHGKIKANLMAKTITIKGSVEGDIFGQERIAITSSSNVKGNLTAERVILEDGAKFRGSIDMDVASGKKVPSGQMPENTSTGSDSNKNAGDI